MVKFALQHRTTVPVNADPRSGAIPGRENGEFGMAQTTSTTVLGSHSSPFFTLPLWKRRQPHRDPSPSPPTHPHLSARYIDVDADARSGEMIRPSDSLKAVLDKALPPTPPTSDDTSHSHFVPGPSRPFPRSITQPPSPSFPSLPSVSESSRPGSSAGLTHQAAVALAHASIGIGLPHVMPRASMSSSASDGHLLPEALRPDRYASGNTVRRAHSSNRLRNQAHSDAYAQVNATRRSFGADDPRHDATVRASIAQVLPADVTPPRPPGLARRPSFWQRRRNDSNKSRAPQSAPQSASATSEFAVTTSSTQLTTLPTLPPVSPLDMGLHITTTDSPLPITTPPALASPLPASPVTRSPRPQPETTPTAPSLVRRLSEKRTPRTPKSATSMEFPPPSKGNRRPSTAGGILERPRSRSLYYETPAVLTTKEPMPSRTLPPPILVPLPAPDEPPTRPHTSHNNQPLLRRLSVNLFSFGSSSNSNTVPSPIHDVTAANSPSRLSPAPSPRTSMSKVNLPPPKPQEGEAPEAYVLRVMEAVSKGDVAGVLAHSGDEFHTQALRAYLSRFEFADDSLDVAVRRLLMDVGLPRETQQIDRVMEAFAARYYQHHPNLYISEDHPYILSFSLIMLHTDAFNKSNKRKMTKADYVKNTRLPGVPPEVLDCFYDNIVFAPFIFIEDPLDRGLDSSSSRFLPGHIVASASASTSSSSSFIKSNKVDPYYLITKNLLHPLRVDVRSFVSLEDPLSIYGTKDAFHEEELRMAFARAGVVEVPAEPRRTSVSLLSSPGFPTPYAPPIPGPDFTPSPQEDVVLKVTNVGLLRRKDIVLQGGKRAPASRKWREWSVILTGSQLLFFRDPVWATHLQEQAASGASQMFMPPSSLLRPDEVMGVRDVLAVYDRSYTQSEHTFMLVMGDGRNILLCAPEEHAMNRWIARINYASTFKTTGIRMRPLGLSGRDVQLMGVAAAKSHMRDQRAPQSSPRVPRVRNWDNRQSGEFVPQLCESPPTSPGLVYLDTPSSHGRVAFEVPTAPSIDGAQQFKAAFDQVKADLAAGRQPSAEDYITRPRALSLDSVVLPTTSSTDDADSKPGSRAHLVRSKIKGLEEAIATGQSELEADLRIVHNIAVLTPFQRATRERLQVAVEGVAKRIRQQRLDLAKQRCQREVLENDLLAEVRDWNRNKVLALKVARDTLQQRRSRDSSTPRMTLSLHLDEPPPLSPSPSVLSSASTSGHMPQSSAAESFHSALDYEWSASTTTTGTDGTAEEHSLTESPLATPLTEEGTGSGSSPWFGSPSAHTPPRSSPAQSRTSLPHRAVEQPKQRRSSDRVNGHGHGHARHERSLSNGHERFVTAHETLPEEAEEWNKTRAAKRVSLVQVPSDLRLSRTHVRSPTLRSVQSGKSSRSSGSPSRVMPSGEDVAAFLC